MVSSLTVKILGLLFLAGAAFLTRLYHLGQDQFWMDEAYSALVSAWPLDKLFAEIPGIGSPPLYNLILHGWISWFGMGETALRLPSALVGALFILLLYWAGLSWFNQKVGLLSSLFCLLSSIHLFYCQQARNYSLLIFLSLLSAHGLWRLLNENKKRYFWGYTSTLILLLYLHNWSLFLIPLPYVFILFHRKFWNQIPKIIGAHFVVFLVYLPFIPSLMAQATSASSTWIAYFFNRTHPVISLLKTFEISFAGGEYFAFKYIPPLRWVAIFFLIGLAAAGFLSKKSNEEKERFGFLLTYLLVPIFIPFLISFARPFYVSGRYDMIVFPAFCLFIGLAFSKLPRRFFISGMALLLFLSSVNLAAFYWIHSPRQENRQKAALLKEKGEAGDVIIFTGFTHTVMRYYMREDIHKFQATTFPADAWKNLGFFDYPSYQREKDTMFQEALERLQEFSTQERRPRRIWVVSNRWLGFVYGAQAESLNEPLYEALFASCRLVKIHPYHKAFILELEPR